MKETLGGRLERALRENAPEAIRGDKRAFQRALQGRMDPNLNRQGTSYPAILSYFADNTSPSLPWLREAAEVLGVRFDWLVTGKGFPTQREQQAEAHKFDARQIDQSTEFAGAVFGDWDVNPRGILPAWAPLGAWLEVRYGMDRGNVLRAVRAAVVACGGGTPDEDALEIYLGALLPAFMAIAGHRFPLPLETDDAQEA